jgi:hypothetical protein
VLVCADGYSSSLAAATLRDLDRPRDGSRQGFTAWKEVQAARPNGAGRSPPGRAGDRLALAARLRTELYSRQAV